VLKFKCLLKKNHLKYEKARNDSLTFESVRSTVQVDSGVWFYEITLLTNGIMQIGFAAREASFLNDVNFIFRFFLMRYIIVLEFQIFF
jgi:hypothetical protein